MKVLAQMAAAINVGNEIIGKAISWLTTALVLVVCYDVFTRYLLRESSVAVQELEWHLFAFTFLLAAAYTLKHDRHVRVDVFYAKMSPRSQAWIDLLGSILFLIPFCLVGIITSQQFVIQSFLIGEISPDPGGLPARFILKAAIPLGFFLLLLQGFSAIVKALQTLAGRSSEGEESGR